MGLKNKCKKEKINQKLADQPKNKEKDEFDK